jgi:hypothetical protein
MPKSNRGSVFGPRSGTVTVIQEPVRRSAARKSQIVFWVVWVAVSLLAATVAASKWHPIIALFAGILIGLVVALVVASAVLIWPVVRAIWWWAPEIGLATGLVIGWVQLADHTTLAYRLGAVAAIISIPAVIPQVRRRLVALSWCLTTRHRIRTCFSEFIITNRIGSLPLILWARPTPVGERVWVWLRPGLALDDIQSRVDLIAVACWADTAVAEAASDTNSAFVRLDTKRRDALTPVIGSPLLRTITPGTPGKNRDTTQVPTALDLPDIHPDEVAPAKAAPARPGKKAHTSVRSTVPDVASDPSDDDVSDWL